MVLSQFLPTLIILTSAVIAILLICYRVWKDRVEEPRKLDDELKEALEGKRADVQAVEPVRQAACAIAYNLNKVIIVKHFGKVPTKIYAIKDLLGIEIFIDNRIIARVLRSGPHKMLDDIAPQVNKVTMRLVFDDPSSPDFELVLWDPNDTLSARAEGPRLAMETARRWFYHVEAIIRRPKDDIDQKLAAAPPPPPAPDSAPPEPKMPLPIAADTAVPETAKPDPEPAKPSDDNLVIRPLVQYAPIRIVS